MTSAKRWPLKTPRGRPIKRRLHRSVVLSNVPGTFVVVQFWEDFITNMPGSNLRQVQMQIDCTVKKVSPRKI